MKTNKTSRLSSPPSVARLLRRTGVAALRRVDATKATAKSPTTRPTGKYVLQLFVAGATGKSRQAILRIRQLCKAELTGNYELEVIDIYQQPKMAHDNQIVATPTLVMEFPRPVRRFIGNMSNITGLLVKLDVGAKGKIAL